MATEDRFVFVTEWFDSQAGLKKEFLLEFYLADQTIDIYDTKHRRMFLKRTKYPQISEADLYVGATVTVYSRQFKIMAYADDFTRKAFHSEEAGGQNLQKAFMLVKPDAYLSIGKIIDAVEQHRYKISNIKMTRLQAQEAQDLLGEKIYQTPFAKDYIDYLISDVSVGIELLRDGGL